MQYALQGNFKKWLHLTFVCNFYSNFSFIAYGALFKRSSMTCNKKKVTLSISQSILFFFYWRESILVCLFFHAFPSFFKEESTGAVLTFLSKSLLQAVLHFKCLAVSQISQGCHKGFSSHTSTRPVHISISVSLKSSDLQPQNGKFNLTVYSIRQFI